MRRPPPFLICIFCPAEAEPFPSSPLRIDPPGKTGSQVSGESDGFDVGMREVADNEILPPTLSGSAHGGSSSGRREEYEVNIMPHPDFGLGLR